MIASTSIEVNFPRQHQGNIFNQHLIGTAIFDAHGLPISYVAVDPNGDATMRQGVFQAVSLKLLLQSSFGLGGFSQAVIHFQEYEIAIAKHQRGYKATIFTNYPQELAALSA